MGTEMRIETFPLSLSQRNIWNLEQAFQGTSVNNISTTIRIRGRVDFVVLKNSICKVLKADSSLRTRLILQGEEPVQYQVPFSEESFPVYDFSHTSKEGIENWEAVMAKEPIPLLKGPLYRFVLFREGETEGGVLVKLHHIISDGWSQVLLCNRIAQTYLELLAGGEGTLEEAPSYYLHVQEEQDYLNSKAYEKDEAYWKKMLQPAGEPSLLKDVNSAAVSPVGCRLSFELSQVLNHAIYSFCMKHRVAPFAVFYMALAIYFKRIGGADRFTIGVPIFNRTNYRFKQSTGMFVTTLPFFNDICENWTFDEFNGELMDAWYELLRHQRFPYSHIEGLAAREGQSGNLFHIALSYQDSKIYESRDASVMFSGTWHYSGYQSEQLCIHLTNLLDNRCYRVDYDYLTQFFTKEEIGRLHHTLCNILTEALAHPDRPIHQLSILTLEEREKVLYTFNKTDVYLRERPVFEALRDHARAYPERVAAIYKGERVTYAVLQRRAACIAGAVWERLESRQGLVAVLLPRGFELLETMTGILQAGSAYLLLSPELPEGRIRTILEKSGAELLITSKAQVGARFGEIPVLYAEEAEEHEPISGEVCSGPQDLAYVVYTSGSTGEPKGVEITQKNLLNLCQAMEPVYGQGGVLSVCNVGFDAFMIESIVALVNGRTIILPTEEELESPRRLAQLIRAYAVGFFAVTPSRLSALLKDHAFTQAMGRMESIVCGGEAFPADLLKKLKNVTFARIYNQYGPSETTVGVSVKELSRAGRITAGRPMDNCRLYVLDKWMNPLPVGVYGQLYVSGTCVGRGYRYASELTEQSFLDNPFELGQRMYATGDSACWSTEGEIILAGRLDHQIKLRGLRIEPQEIAACIAGYPGVKEAAAKVWELNGQTLLAVYYCAEKEISEAALLAFAATYLPRYMIPSYVKRLLQMPVTANGKIDQSRLPAPQWEVGSVAAASGRLTEAVLEIFRQVLGQESLSEHADYFLAGGNSLNAMEVLSRIEETLGRTIRVADLYACRSAARLALYLEGEELSQTGEPGLQKAPREPLYPLSPMQQGIYVQSYLDPTRKAYNMPGLFRITGQPDLPRLEQALKHLIETDALLRTSFEQAEGSVKARVWEEVPFALEQLSGESREAVAEAFVRPFDLARAPLLRAGIWQDPEGSWYLLLDSHHIIGDGMSTPLVLRRLSSFYSGKREEVPFDFYDYRHSLSALEQQGAAELEYWKEHLEELPEPLCLPADETRSHSFDFKGREYRMTLDQSLSRQLESFGREQGLSPYMLVLAAFGLLLSRLSGREDLMVGTPVAGRLLPGSREILGPFINTLPLRLRPEGEKTVGTYLEEIRNEVAGLLDHQKTSLEDLISMLQLPRGVQNPLYQIIFSQSPVDTSEFVLGDGPLEYIPIPAQSVKMDMTVELSLTGGCYGLCFTYASSLFLEETVRYYGRCLETILRALIGGKADLALYQVPALSPADREQYLELPNDMTVPFRNLPIHKLIRRKALADPEIPAVRFHGQVTTLGQMEQMACGMALQLQEAGAKPGQCIGLSFRRSPEMIAAMLAVLKNGCAYVPILAHFPEARLSYMLETSGAELLFCDETTVVQLPESLPCQLLTAEGRMAEHFEDAPLPEDALVNILFTSGSTGQPKGVMLRHRSVANLFGCMKALLDPIPGDTLCSTNTIFDCFIVETLLPLAMGRAVVMADEEEMLLPWKLAELMESSKATIYEMTPARLQMCLGNEAFFRAASHIRIVLLGGEVVTPQLRDRFYQATDGVLMNMYGPTEATVFTTMGALPREGHITVGGPLWNTRLYVLDEHGRPVLPCACGELYIAGECLAGGYIGRPELTQERFLPDPWYPGERMYRSGDLVRQRLDGTYDFLGRLDHQVKLNGQRVELDEITGAVMNTGLAAQAAVVPVKKDDGSMELWCFYEPKEGSVSREQLVAEIRKVLAPYMIPSHFAALEQMPYTATNKVDRLALLQLAEGKDAPEEKIAVAAEPLPEKKTEISVPEKPFIKGDLQQVLSIWGQVLSQKEIDPKKSFFEQGGTSLGALNVLSSYFNAGLEMSLAEFYEVPTAEGQAALLMGRSEGRSSAPGPKEALQTQSVSEKNQETIKPVKEAAPKKEAVKSVKATKAAASEGKPEKPSVKSMKAAKAAKITSAELTAQDASCILVTGATGFFGAHLVKSLLDAGADRILCLMRDGSRSRLLDTLSWYFGQAAVLQAGQKVQAVKGDISQKRLGLSIKEYQALAGRLSAVYHCAADVRHYASDSEEFLDTNVSGTREMLALAAKNHAVFYYISSLSVSGDGMQDGRKNAVFTEEDYDIGQVWDSNLYVKSKYLAEGLVQEAIEAGYPAKIFRLGRLVGRASDGVFQKNPDSNVFYMLLQAFYRLGAVPRKLAEQTIDLTPIDLCAEAVRVLTGSDRAVFHIMDPKPPTVAEAIGGLDREIRVLPDEEFGKLLGEKLSELDVQVSSVLLDFWIRLKSQRTPALLKADITMKELKKAGFELQLPAPEEILTNFFRLPSWIEKEENDGI